MSSNNQNILFNIGKVFLNTFLFLFACFLIGLIYLLFLSRDLPSLEELQRFNPEQVSKIMSSDGEVLSELYFHKRDVVKIGRMPKNLRNALLSMEDRNFYEHSGLRFQSILRAVIINIITVSKKQGASTITQQLARNMYNTIGFKKTINRKLKELITAINIEQTYTKSEIMELYLNSVYFGHGRYGVQAASEHYFGKDVSQLSLDECAILIGLLPAPARYSPINHPDRAIIRRDLVLSVMNNQEYISDVEYDLFINKSLPERKIIKNKGIAPYFTEHIRRELEKIDEELEVNLYKDGLMINTTLDSRVQHILNKYFNEGLEKNQRIFDKELISDDIKLDYIANKNSIDIDSLMKIVNQDTIIPPKLRNQLLVQGAAVVIDPSSGSILGMIGGRQEDVYVDHFNRSSQAKRQPGSVFKPFIYLTALEKGYNAVTQLLNQPLIHFFDDTLMWNPQNHDGSTGLLTTLREGLKRSLNLISVRVVNQLEKVNPFDVASNAKQFNIKSSIQAYPSIALGVSEVTLKEIAAAYSAISNEGIYVEPIAITRIEDRHGAIIKEFVPKINEVKNNDIIYILRDMMKSVIDEGTGGSIRWKYKFSGPLAGKTGTTNSKADAWFVGFTPQITIGVWVGLDDPAVSLGEKQFGSVAALPIFANSIKKIYDQAKDYSYLNKRIILDDKLDWKVPPGIEKVSVCKQTYNLASDYCPQMKEIFRKNFKPREYCKKHQNPFKRFDKN